MLRVDDSVIVNRELSTWFLNERAGQLPPFTGPFTGNRAGAHLTHTPIPFADSVSMLVFENAIDNAGRFHKVAGTLHHVGLVHAWTSNPTFRWKEGGELEVELPRALTAGKSRFTVELRPRANTDPFNLARTWVYGYTRP